MKVENSKPATDVVRQAKKTGSRAILIIRLMTQSATVRHTRPTWLECAVCAVAVATVAIATTLSLTAGF